MPTSAASLHEGDRFGRYQLRERLGAGGMGVVYRAIDRTTGALVALKVLADADPAAARRFEHEARLHARLQHPLIPRLIEATTVEGCRCIAMDYVGGVTLTQYIARRGRLRAAEATALFSQLAEAVGHLHACRVVHGDLKADNVKVLPDGQLRLLDFGIARELVGPVPVPASGGEVAGSVHSLAPEVLNGAPAGLAADVWALGVMLYEMCTGLLPFDGATLEQVIAQVHQAAPVPAVQRVPDLPPALSAVIDGCLQRDLARRWPSVAAMLAALNEPVATPLPAATPRSAWTLPRLAMPVLPWTSGGRVAWAAIAAGCCGLLSLLLLLLALMPWGAPVQDWWRFPPEADLAAMRDRGEWPQAEVRIDSLGGAAELWAGDRLLGRTPFTARAPIGARVALRLRWGDGLGERDIAFEVRDLASDNAYTYQPPSP